MRLLAFCLLTVALWGKVTVGLDTFFEEGYPQKLQGKRVGLITNHTSLDGQLKPAHERFLEAQEIKLVALFAPEHGFLGSQKAGEDVKNTKRGSLPVYSLHGKTRRPTDAMLKNVDLLVFDMQESGCRGHTYPSTLFFAMEEAAKHKIPLYVLDRPNPMGGTLIDGPMMQDKWRSFVGYVNVPYCHGMTMGELARFFNEEYEINCELTVVPMKGWTRNMSYRDTGLLWMPTSPNIPEPETPLYCAATGILGELPIVDIGVGTPLAFKIVGAPWIDAVAFQAALEKFNLSGIRFIPYHWQPILGRYKEKECHGVLLSVTDPAHLRPYALFSLLVGTLKALYPTKFQDGLMNLSGDRKKLFCQVTGGEEIFDLMKKEGYITWKLLAHNKEEREAFLAVRQKYLIYD